MAPVTRVLAKQLDDRIVATYYKREFVENEARLLRSPIRKLRLSELVTAGRRAVYFRTTTLERDGAPPDWVPFLTSDDMDDSGCFVDLDARRRVSPDFADRYPNGTLRGNELLVKVKGPNQTTAYQEALPAHRVLVSGTIWGSLVRRDRVDPHYLVAVLSSPYAAMARTRLRTNLNVEFLSPADLQALLLPIPAEAKSQAYIGDKVRQAERLRASAKGLEEAVNRRLDGSVPPFERVPQRCSWITGEEMGDRLDAQPYRTHFRSLLASVQAVPHSSVRKIATLSGGDPVPSGEFKGGGVPLVRIRDIGPNGFVTPEVFVSEVYAATAPEYAGRAGMIVIGMDGEFRAQFFIEPELPQHVNQRVAMIQATGIRPELLSLWLNRAEGQYQLNRWAVKTTVEHTTLEHIGNVLIPRLSEAEENDLADRLKQARWAKWFANALTTAAKLLVEALVEGKVSEADLKEAQEALQRGDQGPDRAILSRLTRKGLDVPNEPRLFPDLDALYQALGQVNHELSHTTE
jgi:type I restriction enzyme S subunit